MRSSVCGLAVVVAVLWLCAVSASPAPGEDSRPAANTGGSVKANEIAEAPAADHDAASAWMHQTVARPKDSIRPLRAPAEGPPPIHKNSLLGRDGKTGTIELVWPLLLVLGAIAGATLVIRKILPRGNRLGGGGVIDVVASHYLSSKQSLCLVRLGRRAVLLGVTPERITPVAEILEAEELAEIVAAIERKRPTSFTSTFARLCARDSGKRVHEEPAEGQVLLADEKLTRAGEAVRGLVDRIRTLSGTPASAEPT